MAGRNINDIYNLMVYIVRKERGNFPTVAEAMAALHAGQLSVYEKYFALYGANQTIHDAITLFKTTYPFTTDATGKATFPSDYLHTLITYTTSGSTMYKIKMVQEDELADAVNSALRPISVTKPLGRDIAIVTNLSPYIIATGLQLYPQVAQTGILIYMRQPAYPVLGYTQVGRTITYNPFSSTQLEFTDIYIDEIIGAALGYLGINMGEVEIAQFGQQIQNI